MDGVKRLLGPPAPMNPAAFTTAVIIGSVISLLTLPVHPSHELCRVTAARIDDNAGIDVHSNSAVPT